jgi:hypothetical protein
MIEHIRKDRSSFSKVGIALSFEAASQDLLCDVGPFLGSSLRDEDPIVWIGRILDAEAVQGPDHAVSHDLSEADLLYVDRLVRSLMVRSSHHHVWSDGPICERAVLIGCHSQEVLTASDNKRLSPSHEGPELSPGDRAVPTQEGLCLSRPVFMPDMGRAVIEDAQLLTDDPEGVG